MARFPISSSAEQCAEIENLRGGAKKISTVFIGALIHLHPKIQSEVLPPCILYVCTLYRHVDGNPDFMNHGTLGFRNICRQSCIILFVICPIYIYIPVISP